MSFTWPDIPFQGSEVTAFAAAYKELAEAILDDYFNAPIGHLAGMVPPYKEKLVMKELLQEGLFYGCFIIQQRSGTTGPGTDFVLENTPIDISDPDLKPKVLRLLGCKWGQFEDSYKNNMECGKAPPESPPIEDDRCCEEGANFLEGLTINTINTFMYGNPWRDMLSSLLNKYLNCETDVFTAADLNSNDLEKIRDDLQKAITNRDRLHHDYGYAAAARGRQRVVDNTSAYSTAKLASMGATKVWNVSTYSSDGHYVVGYVDVTVDGNDTVLCMRDDYDFMYGWEMDRSNGSFPGDPYSGKQPGYKTINPDGSPRTHEQVSAEHGDFGRDLVINSFFGCNGGGHVGGGRGAPVPINVCF